MWCVQAMRRIPIPRQVRNVAVVVLTLAAIAPPAYTAIGYDANAAKAASVDSTASTWAP